ncbi:MAG: GDYXXLXY domain-containing protein [Elusimicrobium sp.]|jgi:uncharacterized membrane-anchored protein|nr:GDYXXLXY domain-containing protein [Elusimicrobium sp.]
MRAKLFLLFIFLICAALVYAVWQKEMVLKNGQTFYMELRPTDPRSLMQGDYMALRYAEDSFCLKLDDKNIARAYECDRCICKIVLKHKPDSFFFQEGHAEIYSRAKYAILKGSDNGVQITSVLLAGLADENLKELKP